MRETQQRKRNIKTQEKIGNWEYTAAQAAYHFLCLSLYTPVIKPSLYHQPVTGRSMCNPHFFMHHVSSSSTKESTCLACLFASLPVLSYTCSPSARSPTPLPTSPVYQALSAGSLLWDPLRQASAQITPHHHIPTCHPLFWNKRPFPLCLESAFELICDINDADPTTKLVKTAKRGNITVWCSKSSFISCHRLFILNHCKVSIKESCLIYEVGKEEYYLPLNCAGA